MKSNSKKKQYPEQDKMYIGSAWDKEIKGKEGFFKVVNIAFMGNRDQDEYEVVLLNKADGTFIPLHSAPYFVSLVERKTKEKENSPDYSVVLSFPKDE
ncbi:MAG: hypothetical protein KDB74_06595 [Flavobacteriales bacterium]|nr:hypothetical protein [Flavobacteriales bacterium]